MEETFFHSLDSVPLKDVIREEYRAYQIYTLMDRAIPYLQDGLKPGQRRILFTLWKNQNKGLVKVTAATGLVLTLHPHGPASIETAIVNMAQDYTFSNNYPLIAKKGYFGERMEPTPAAGRYIECKLDKMGEYLLFDDMNQVEMIPNYDEKVMEPAALYPKLPIMLLNGAEGIGTGFSSSIPSFHHTDIVDSMIQMVETGKPKKIRPYFHNFSQKIIYDDKGRMIFDLKIEEIGGKIFITEIPRYYDAARIYRFLNRFVDQGFLKDFIDSSVNNDIKIELVFKRGAQPPLEKICDVMKCSSSMVPNYTLISERGIRIFDTPEQIIEHFTLTRITVVRRRYELLCEEYERRIRQNNEIIRFIKEKHFAKATVSKNRKTFVEYLEKKKFTFSDYLADMPIYRMTKEEVEKRALMVKDDTRDLKSFTKVAKSDALVRQKLIEELLEVKDCLTAWLRERDLAKKKIDKELHQLEKKFGPSRKRK